MANLFQYQYPTSPGLDFEDEKWTGDIITEAVIEAKRVCVNQRDLLLQISAIAANLAIEQGLTIDDFMSVITNAYDSCLIVEYEEAEDVDLIEDNDNENEEDEEDP